MKDEKRGQGGRKKRAKKWKKNGGKEGDKWKEAARRRRHEGRGRKQREGEKGK